MIAQAAEAKRSVRTCCITIQHSNGSKPRARYAALHQCAMGALHEVAPAARGSRAAMDLRYSGPQPHTLPGIRGRAVSTRHQDGNGKAMASPTTARWEWNGCLILCVGGPAV